MKWVPAIAVVLLAGCDWLLGVDAYGRDDAGPIADGETFFDGPPAGVVCVGKDLEVRLCFVKATLSPMTITQNTKINTTDADCPRIMTLTDNTSVCVLAATSLSIGATLTAIGPRPLVLVGTDLVTITGTIDVSSATTKLGAGANDARCATPQAGQMQSASGMTSGGGAGGSFAGTGGLGGAGDNTVARGAPHAIATSLRGGCAGGDGGLDHDSVNQGIGGPSGGAVDVASNGAITISGRVYATGAFGTGAAVSDGFPGGGGGGAGGMIVLDGMTVTLAPSSVLLAAGASGGAGGDTMFAGMDGSVPTGAGAAPGGTITPPSEGGLGGNSSGGGSVDGQNGRTHQGTQGGGGGGGGAAGFIKLYPPPAATGTVVPTPS